MLAGHRQGCGGRFKRCSVVLPPSPGREWGFRTTKARNKTKTAAKTEPFFGYKVHAISDAVHGVSLTHIILPANLNHSPQLAPLVDKSNGLYPSLAEAQSSARQQGLRLAGQSRASGQAGNHTDHSYPAARRQDQAVRRLLHRPRAASMRRRQDADGVRGDQPNDRFPQVPASTGRLRSHGAVQYCDTTELWLDPADNYRALGIVLRDYAEWKRLYARRQVIERMFDSPKRSRLLDRHRYGRRR